MYTTFAANDFLVAGVTNNHFELGAYSNATRMFNEYLLLIRNASAESGRQDIEYKYPTDSPDFQLFISMLEGYNSSTPNYEDLTPSQCISLYNTNLLSGHRNIFLITNHTSNPSSNNTILGLSYSYGFQVMIDTWWCPPSLMGAQYCDTNKLVSEVVSGLPWLVLGEEVEVSGCKSEITKEKCKVQFSLGIMIIVICYNLAKACSMIMTVVRSREPTLVTLDDAIDSFLRIPDPTTMGICFADRRFIEREWKREYRAGPKHWTQNGVQRWWTGVSKTRWITCNLFCSIAIITTGVLLRWGLKQERYFSSANILSL